DGIRDFHVTGVQTCALPISASHPDAIWNAQCSLTAVQRQRICVRALALVGRAYDYPAYTGFALKVLRPRDGAELDPVFKADHWQDRKSTRLNSSHVKISYAV